MQAQSTTWGLSRERAVRRAARRVVGLVTMAGALLALGIELRWLVAAEGGSRQVAALCIALGALALLTPDVPIAVASRIAGFAAIAVGFPAMTLTFISERPPAVVERIAGVDAVGTALAASESAFSAADTVVLIGSRDTAVAYAAASLAASLGSPLLLTSDTNLHRATVQELRRLGAERAIVVGNAPSAHIERRLGWLGIEASRIAGTPAAIAASIASRSTSPTMLVLVGDRGAAARASAAAAAATAITQRVPIVRAGPEGLPLETAAAILEQHPTRVIVEAPTQAVRDDLRRLGVPSLTELPRASSSSSTAWVASGDAPMDVAVASAAAAGTGADIVILRPGATAGGTLTQPLSRYAEVMVVGGTAAVSDEAVEART